MYHQKMAGVVVREVDEEREEDEYEGMEGEWEEVVVMYQDGCCDGGRVQHLFEGVAARRQTPTVAVSVLLSPSTAEEAGTG